MIPTLRFVPLAALLALLPAGCRSGGDAPALESDTRDLPATELVAALEAPLAPAENRLWCASLAVAWEALEELVGGEVRADRAPEALDWLNTSAVGAADLDPASVVAGAGRIGDGVIERLQDELVRRFGERDPDLDGYALWPAGAAIAYAQLWERLEFATAFEDLDDAPVAFRFVTDGVERTRAVDAFGIESYDPSQARHRRLREQVRVRHWAGPEDFVVQLVAKGSTDELLLARVPPASTLGATWAEVEVRLARPAAAERLAPGETLAAPELDFRLVHSFTELAGLLLANEGFEGLPLLAVTQSLRLALDEHGLVVRSRASAAVASAASPEPRRFVLDGPFLLAAREAGARSPWLVAWIAHPEILVPAE